VHEANNRLDMLSLVTEWVRGSGGPCGGGGGGRAESVPRLGRDGNPDVPAVDHRRGM